MIPVDIIGLGLGPEHLGSAAMDIISRAEVLAGGSRLLDFFPDHPGRRLAMTTGLAAWLDQVAEAAKTDRVAVLASGDPNFFGVAGRLVERLGPENVRIHPNVSTVQTAFAELKETWAEAGVVSLHGRNADALFGALGGRDRVAIFTDPKNTPSAIAGLMLDRGQKFWRMTVLENLGRPEARVTSHSLEEAAGLEFSPLNMTILSRIEGVEPLTLGTPDDRFEHEAGLITKAEIRAAALAKLELGPGMTLWDLGAGCGSVGIEATLLLAGGRVAAVERRPERARQIEINRARFGAAILEVTAGEMPDILAQLPDPDRIFVGGAGAGLGEIVSVGIGRLPEGGVILVSAVQLTSVETARRTMTDLGLDPEVTHIQISRGAPLAGDLYMKALNPVWLIKGRKT